MKKLFFVPLFALSLACGTTDNDDLIIDKNEGSFTVSGSISATASEYPCETSYIASTGISGVTIAVGNIGQTDDVVIINLVGDGNVWTNTTYTDDPDLNVLPNMLCRYINADDAYTQDADVRSSVTFSQVGVDRVKGTFDINLVRSGGTDKINVKGEFDDEPNN